MALSVAGCSSVAQTVAIRCGAPSLAVFVLVGFCLPLVPFALGIYLLVLLRDEYFPLGMRGVMIASQCGIDISEFHNVSHELVNWTVALGIVLNCCAMVAMFLYRK